MHLSGGLICQHPAARIDGYDVGVSRVVRSNLCCLHLRYTWRARGGAGESITLINLHLLSCSVIVKEKKKAKKSQNRGLVEIARVCDRTSAAVSRCSVIRSAISKPPDVTSRLHNPPNQVEVKLTLLIPEHTGHGLCRHGRAGFGLSPTPAPGPCVTSVM